MTGQWTMPTWMEPFRDLIQNTGGNYVEDLVNDRESNSFSNAIRAALCVAVKSQVALLTLAHDSGLLRAETKETPPHVADDALARLPVPMRRYMGWLDDEIDKIDRLLAAPQPEPEKPVPAFPEGWSPPQPRPDYVPPDREGDEVLHRFRLGFRNINNINGPSMRDRDETLNELCRRELARGEGGR
jgi:hypothetical protein